MEYIKHIFLKLGHSADFKFFGAIFMGAFSFLFDETHTLALSAVFFLVIIDFFFGISASRKTGEAIRSSKVVRTAIKLVVYFSLIAAARVSEYALPFDFLDGTVIGFLAATELLSILENAGRMGYAVPRILYGVLGDYVASKNTEARRRGAEYQHKKKK